MSEKRVKYIDKIKYKDYVHFVYSKAPHYWLISRYQTKSHMFSVLVEDLKLSKAQKEEQKEICLTPFEHLWSKPLK